MNFKKFKITVKCKECGSTNVDIYSGIDCDWTENYGNLELRCRKCKNSEEERE